MSGNTISSTNPSLLGGLYARLGDRFGLSTGVETLFSDPLQLTFAGSVQFEPVYDSDDGCAPHLRSRTIAEAC